MKAFKRIVSTLVAGAALLAAGHASAVTWQWSYSGAGVVASGTFTTAGNAIAPEDVLSISGQRNGKAILGLVPLDDDGNFSYDNQFQGPGIHFTSDGLLFNVGGGQAGHINLYYFGGTYTDLYIDDNDDAFETAVTFAVTAVPEAATAAQLGLGLAGMGLVALRRRRAAV